MSGALPMSGAPHQEEVRDRVQQEVHEHLSRITNEKWQGSITFPLDKGASGHLKSLDVCQFIGKSVKELGLPRAKAPTQFHRPHRSYFDTEKFPPPGATVDGRLPVSCESWNNLKFALESAGNTCGSPIISNGSNGSKRSRVFLCSFKYV